MRLCSLVAACTRRKHLSNRVLRGGSWNNNARNVRAAMRNNMHPQNRNNNVGFRGARAHRVVGWPHTEQARARGSAGCQIPKATGLLVRRCVTQARMLAGWPLLFFIALVQRLGEFSGHTDWRWWLIISRRFHASLLACGAMPT